MKRDKNKYILRRQTTKRRAREEDEERTTKSFEKYITQNEDNLEIKALNHAKSISFSVPSNFKIRNTSLSHSLI